MIDGAKIQKAMIQFISGFVYPINTSLLFIKTTN